MLGPCEEADKPLQTMHSFRLVTNAEGVCNSTRLGLQMMMDGAGRGLPSYLHIEIGHDVSSSIDVVLGTSIVGC